MTSEAKTEAAHATLTGARLRALQSELDSKVAALGQGKGSLRAAEDAVAAAVTQEAEARAALARAEDRLLVARGSVPRNRVERAQPKEFEALVVGEQRRVATAGALVTSRREAVRHWTKNLKALELDISSVRRRLAALGGA